jgi:hypothetical protein
VGAFAGIAQTQAHFAFSQFQFSGDPGVSIWTLDERTVVKFALTALTLSLL